MNVSVDFGFPLLLIQNGLSPTLEALKAPSIEELCNTGEEGDGKRSRFLVIRSFGYLGKRWNLHKSKIHHLAQILSFMERTEEDSVDTNS